MEERDKLYFREITHEDYGYTHLFRKEWKEELFVRKEIFNEGLIVNNIDSSYIYIDDKYMVEDETRSIKSGFRFNLIAIIVLGIIIYCPNDNFFSEQAYALQIFIGWLFLTIFFLVFSIYSPIYLYIYNRLDGTMTIPRRWGLGSCTMPFDKVRFAISTGQMGSSTLTVLGAKCHFWNKNIGAIPENSMSIIVWYMDKNRPLPLGKAFDPYRKRDYECRKAEGFPDPLYPSHIITDEYKPELTIEAHHGKMINIETIGREAGSEWYNPQKHLGWTTIRYIKDKQDISPLQYELIRYEFEDDRIIYARTTGNGEVARPPETEKFKESQIVGAALKFKEPKKEKSAADRWAERNL